MVWRTCCSAVQRSKAGGEPKPRRGWRGTVEHQVVSGGEGRQKETANPGARTGSMGCWAAEMPTSLRMPALFMRMSIFPNWSIVLLTAISAKDSVPASPWIAKHSFPGSCHHHRRQRRGTEWSELPGFLRPTRPSMTDERGKTHADEHRTFSHSLIVSSASIFSLSETKQITVLAPCGMAVSGVLVVCDMLCHRGKSSSTIASTRLACERHSDGPANAAVPASDESDLRSGHPMDVRRLSQQDKVCANWSHLSAPAALSACPMSQAAARSHQKGRAGVRTPSSPACRIPYACSSCC